MKSTRFTADGRYCELLLSNGDDLHVVTFTDNEPVIYRGKLYSDLPIAEFHKDIEKLRSKKHQLKTECQQLERERDRLRGEIKMAQMVKNHG